MAETLTFQCITCCAVLIDTVQTESCGLCGQTEETELICPSGHSFCAACRLAEPAEAVSRVCLSTQSGDPFQIANTVMLHPHFRCNGPAFHFIVAPVLIASACNSGCSGDKSESIARAGERMQSIPAMACGAGCLGKAAYHQSSLFRAG